MPQAGDFEKITAIIGPHRIRMDAHALDQMLGIRRKDHIADALLAGGCRDAHGGAFGGRGTHCPRAPATSVVALRRVSETRFPARSSDSKVPASVHQPSKCA